MALDLFLSNESAYLAEVATDKDSLYDLIRELSWEVRNNTNQVEVLKTNGDNFFLVINAVFILMMQAGFAFFEAGSIRSKNAINVLFKNVLDTFIGGFVFWACGYALAFGEPPCNQIIGMNNFFGIGLSGKTYSAWFFHYSFCITAATIVSGALAERCQMRAYVCYSIVITGLIYPIGAHWAWHGGKICKGWLKNYEYQDYAGSGVVHVVGGSCALVGAIVIGPRAGAFPKSGDVASKEPLQGHNMPLTCLGALLLFIGFFAFNGGSQASMSMNLDGEQTGRAITNTVMAACPAALTGLILGKLFTGYLKLDVILSSGLSGMVAICAGCNVVSSFGAVFIGATAGALEYGMSRLMKILKIDDPVDAVAVHLFPGLWGVIATPLLDLDDGVFIYWNTASLKGLGHNILGSCVIIGWSLITSWPMFYTLKQLNWLRVDSSVEMVGCDKVKHGQEAYPERLYCQHCAEILKCGTIATPGSHLRDRSNAVRFQKHVAPIYTTEAMERPAFPNTPENSPMTISNPTRSIQYINPTVTNSSISRVPDGTFRMDLPPVYNHIS